MLGKLKAKGLQRVAGKINKAMPALTSFAVENDIAYEKLIDTIREINTKRQEGCKYIYFIPGKRA